MSKTRIDITGELEVVTPLHVGSGTFRSLPAAAQDQGECPEVAEIVRDADGAPYLPPTTLKGLLRRLMEAMPDQKEQMPRLLGEIKNDGQGRMGALLMRGARRLVAPNVQDAPYAEERGIFVAARTRVDPQSGTAKDSALFFQEMAAAGSRFEFRASIETRHGDADELAGALVAVLDRLTVTDGQAIGKGQADGFGRVRLDADTVRITRHVLASSGRLEVSDATALWRDRVPTPAASPAVRLTLRCDGPFAVIDASRKSKRGERKDDDKIPQLAAQRLTERLPLLLGSSVSGALRARAGWLAALAIYRKAGPQEGNNPLDGLFGTTGRRGRLMIERLEVAEAEPWTVTSVKLDRFSGAPIDNALFSTATFTDVNVEMDLRLDARASDAEQTLFDYLITDITDNGLQLGHGGNKGFGWFTVTRNDDVH